MVVKPRITCIAWVAYELQEVEEDFSIMVCGACLARLFVMAS